MAEAVPGLDLAGVRAVEERAFNAWPATETRLAEGWVLRFADGYTRRANSLNAWQPTASIDAVLGHARAFFAARRVPLVVRVSPLAGAEADARLEALGFAAADETMVMTARMADLARAATSPGVGPGEGVEAAIELAERPLARWLEGFSDANAVPPERRPLHGRIVSAIGQPVAFATLSRDEAAVGWGLGVVERGQVGLFDLATAPHARRQGVARRLVGGLLEWAEGEGATAAYLQVVAANAPAIRLYERLGFREAYRYHYRIAPATMVD